MIGNARAELLKLGLPLGADHETLSPAAIKKHAAAPLSSLRARRARRLLRRPRRRDADPQRSHPLEGLGHRRMDQARCNARLLQGSRPVRRGTPHGEVSFHEERFTRLLPEGETNTDTIIGETFDKGAW